MNTAHTGYGVHAGAVQVRQSDWFSYRLAWLLPSWFFHWLGYLPTLRQIQVMSKAEVVGAD